MSSDDDDYYQPGFFAPYTQNYRVQEPRHNHASQNINFIHKIQLVHKLTNNYKWKTQLVHNPINQWNTKPCQYTILSANTNAK